MSKLIEYDEIVCCVMEVGMDKLVDIVWVMLGLCGWYVVLVKVFGGFMVINDGVMVVCEIELEDLFEDLGV